MNNDEVIKPVAKQIVEVKRIEDRVPDGVVVSAEHDADRAAERQAAQVLANVFSEKLREILDRIVRSPRPALQCHRAAGLLDFAANAVNVREIGQVAKSPCVARAKNRAAVQVVDRLEIVPVPDLGHGSESVALGRLGVQGSCIDVRRESGHCALELLEADIALGECHRRFQIAFEGRAPNTASEAKFHDPGDPELAAQNEHRNYRKPHANRGLSQHSKARPGALFDPSPDLAKIAPQKQYGKVAGGAEFMQEHRSRPPCRVGASRITWRPGDTGRPCGESRPHGQTERSVRD